MKSILSYKSTPCNSQKNIAVWMYPAALLLLILACVCPVLSQNALFGSEGDWFSQHVAIAEQYRTAFYETGKILPDWLPLGGGCNSYDFSYYGFLRPDVLLSFLLPNVPMTYIISGYAVFGLAAGTLLCYFWLKRHVQFSFFAFVGAILYACAACFYHTHHQIMFVNYMPFLILALWGTETLIQKGRFALLVLSLLMVCLHSYYFAPAVLVVCLVYFLYCLAKEQNLHGFGGWFKKADFRRWFPVTCKFAASIILAIGMAAILLIPTGLDLLSTSKDAGTPASLSDIFSVNLNLNSLLYHPYGCGLTVLCLYTLLLSIRRTRTRLLSVFLLLCLTVNTCAYLLSGLLYVRYKVLIPLVPLLLMLCAATLEALFTGRERHSLILGLLCLTPAIFSKYSLGILADSLWLLFSFSLIHFGKRRALHRYCSSLSRSGTAASRRILPLFLILCAPSLCISDGLRQHEDYVYALDKRQLSVYREDVPVLDAINTDPNYRFECLSEPFVNVNTQPLPKLGRTSMYSSVTDKHYADFYYNTMRNPIRIRNRVALMTDANPFFSYLMGIRYIQTNRELLPLGYSPIKAADSNILAENPNVLPIAYTSNSFMTENEFQKLDFPYTLEALTKYTIIPEEETNRVLSVTKNAFMKSSQIHELSPEELHLTDLSRNRRSSQAETELTLPLPSDLKSRLLIITAEVASSGNEVVVDINQIRNKRSGSDAPYPNHNDTFTWIISSNNVIQNLSIRMSAGDYTLSRWKVWSMDTHTWGNNTIRPLQNQEMNPVSSEKQPGAYGTTLLNATAALDQPGYFTTSLPCRKGYKAYVNGKETAISRVNQTFIGIPLESGTCQITLVYCPPGKIISCWISLLSLLLFIGWELSFRCKHSARHAHPLRV
ncbi:MAG: YfhO family protein [Lachnospiraceae bacterium]|nr:YfhO family protein [Lachnospiraceae bacterium]